MLTKVCIMCPIHGDFWQHPQRHLEGGGCKKCACSTHNNKVCGVGINDIPNNIKPSLITQLSYHIWHHMLRRCYNQDKKMKSYYDCRVCDDWLVFSNFHKWFTSILSEYKTGYQLDKDILIKGNKVYSPETCCFVPQQINLLLVNHKRDRGEFPLGVQKQTCSENFMVRLMKYGSVEYVGTFNSVEEAFYAYKQAKEAHIKEVAQKYYDEGKITKRVYDALMRYEVEITD